MTVQELINILSSSEYKNAEITVIYHIPSDIPDQFGRLQKTIWNNITKINVLPGKDKSLCMISINQEDA